MNTIDDLRATLDQHAHGLVDHDVAARVGGVRTRVGIMRRRRRAAAGAAAALAVVGGGVALLPLVGQDRDVAPASRVVGVLAPRTLTSYGFTYAFDEAVEGDGGRARVELKASSEPRLISWATSGADDTVTVTGPGEQPVVYENGDFADFVYVPAGDAYEVVAEVGTGRAGLATYTLTDERPAGVTAQGVTYRQEIAGGSLLGAAIGAPGEADVSFTAAARTKGVALKYFCSGGPDDAFLHVAIGDAGEVISGSGCGDRSVPIDAAARGGSAFPTRTGEDVSTRLYVTAGKDGPVIEDPDLRIGVGSYALDGPGVPGTFDGFFPRSVESAGHAWELVGTQDVTPGEAALEVVAPAGRGPILAVVGTDLAAGPVVVHYDGQRDNTVMSAGQSGATNAVVADGGTVRAGLDRGVFTEDDRVRIAFYVQAD